MDKFSFLNAASSAYFAQLYDQYLQFPDSVEPSWRAFFQGFDFGLESNGEAEAVFSETVTQKDVEVPKDLVKEFRVVELINAYRSRGHLFTRTNPVRERRTYSPTLAIENFGLTQADMDTVFNSGEILGRGPLRLAEIIDHLKKIYCSSIGIEYMYIQKPEEVQWIQNRLNTNDNLPQFDSEAKKHILGKLNEAVSFEAFLQKKFVGQKRFSLEGNESLIPALDAIIEAAAEKGLEDFVMGMAHRGRLNTLANIFGKSTKDIFGEFEGKDYELEVFDGDVKYHLGWTSCRLTSKGKGITMNMAPNPSHLETVGAVVEGIVRGKQERSHKNNISEVLPIIVHGDAAISGQGIAYEIVQMSQLDGYKTGGTIHIVVNNQIGFTTNYLDGRSSIYCTDVAKVTAAPVLHVNADDPEAVVHAALFALDYRMKFGKDVFLDLLGYRKYGHNEGDEPRFTQPKLYKAISKHENVLEIYSEKLAQNALVDKEYIKQIGDDYKAELEQNLEISKKEKTTVITPIMHEEWDGYEIVEQEEMLKPVDTTVDMKMLTEVAKVVSTLPEDKKFMRKAVKVIKEREKRFFETDELDWAMAEHLAYGTLLKEGFSVRMSGQDVERGTFSHRHAVLKVEESEEEVIFLKQLENGENNFNIYNSLLSEYAVTGYDYGYAMARPDALTIWEAQFGDFSNGAQIVIDQYISAAEDKWKLQNGLVMLLPHGYEGQGAEHSSARMERYLQLCGKDNMFAVNCTTPANMFHVLRRQMKTNYRKPLIVFTPKSLLRHPKVISTKKDFAEGGFQPLLDDPTSKPAKTKTLVFCTGKFYYDLLAHKEEHKRDDVALVRIEQLFPLPKAEMEKMIEKYKKADDIVWAQEEPRNMGAYSHLLMRFSQAVNFRVCSQHFHSSPAAGSSARFKRRHDRIIENVFDITTMEQ